MSEPREASLCITFCFLLIQSISAAFWHCFVTMFCICSRLSLSATRSSAIRGRPLSSLSQTVIAPPKGSPTSAHFPLQSILHLVARVIF